MTYEEFKDALDGLFAYDSGCTDSGIHDEGLRARCIQHFESLKPDEQRHLLGKLTVDMWLSEEAMKQGYGAEDAKRFLEWVLDDNFGS